MCEGSGYVHKPILGDYWSCPHCFSHKQPLPAIHTPDHTSSVNDMGIVYGHKTCCPITRHVITQTVTLADSV